MEPQAWSDIMKMAMGAGMGTALLVVAVWYLNRTNLALSKEAKDATEKRITAVETEASQCKVDRGELQRQISALNAEIINIYKTRAQGWSEAQKASGNGGSNP